jgi:hypothetical protein
MKALIKDKDEKKVITINKEGTLLQRGKRQFLKIVLE